MRGKKSFVLYSDQKELFDQLPDELAGRLIKHIFSYVNDEDPETDDLLLKVAFASIKQALKRDLKNWESIKKKRREAGRKGGKATQANARSAKANQAVNVNVNDNVNVNVNDSVIEKNKKGFTPPSLQEVSNYCLERGNDIDAENFVNFYDSKNWMIGKNKMKDWKAAIRTWEKRKEKSFGQKEKKSRLRNIFGDEAVNELKKQIHGRDDAHRPEQGSLDA